MTIEREQLLALRRGDRQAQKALYGRIFPVLMAICLRYRRDRAEAVSSLNQGFLKICLGIETWREDEVPFLAWARRIMLNTVIDEFRREKREREFVENIDPADLARVEKGSTFNPAESNMAAEEILGFLKKIPPVSARVFNLFVIDGLSHDEIASALGITEGTSKWHLNNARTRLKELIVAHGII